MLGFNWLLLALSFVEIYATCYFEFAFYKFPDQQVCNRNPEAWQDIDNVPITIVCKGWSGYDLTLSVRQPVLFIDKKVSVATFFCRGDPCTGRFIISIPFQLRTCNPSQYYYLSLVGGFLGRHEFTSCEFLPFEFSKGLDCDRITFPISTTVLTTGPPPQCSTVGQIGASGTPSAPVGSICQFPFKYQLWAYDRCTTSDNNGVPWCFVASGQWGNCQCPPTNSNNQVSWQLESSWSDLNLEFYLFRDISVSIVPDGWWFLGNVQASALSLTYDLTQLGVSTTRNRQFYIAAYYRRWFVFTTLVMRSPIFIIDDANTANDALCRAETLDTKWRLVCCSVTGKTVNDICRIGTKSDLLFQVQDFVISIGRGVDMCQMGTVIHAFPRISFADGGQVSSISTQFEKSATMADLISTPLLSLPLLDSIKVTGLPSKVVGAQLSLDVTTMCVNNEIGIKVSLVATASVLGFSQEAEVMTLFEQALYKLPGPSPRRLISDSNFTTPDEVILDSVDFINTAVPCDIESNCSIGEYCDDFHTCEPCVFLTSHCDAVEGDCCGQELSMHCPQQPHPCVPSSTSVTITSCESHEDCINGTFCGSARQCTLCDYVTTDICGSFDGSCCSPSFLTHCSVDPSHCKDQEECAMCEEKFLPCSDSFNDPGNVTSLTQQQCSCVIPWMDCIVSKNCTMDHQVYASFITLHHLVPSCYMLSAAEGDSMFQTHIAIIICVIASLVT